MSVGITEKLLIERLRTAGLRPTKQRVALGYLMFAQGKRHFTAEMLHEEAIRDDITVSLATVYNTLHQFTQANLIREIAVEGSKTHFDTNTSSHYHFYIENEGQLVDIESDLSPMIQPPAPPEGYEISQIDILVRLRKKTAD